MLKKMLRPFLLRLRRYMQAEVMHEIMVSRHQAGGGSGTAPGLNVAMENALLTIALHAEDE